MKGMPLPFDFEGKGVLGFVTDSSFSSSSTFSNPLFLQFNLNKEEGCWFVGSCEPTSVLETIRSPSPPTSTSTLSSSLGSGGGVAGGGGGFIDTTAGVAAVSGNPSQKWPSAQQEIHLSSNAGSSELRPALKIDICNDDSATATAGGAADKCGLVMEDWESALSESVAASPSQEQSIFRWIMGDVEDPSMGLNKLLQSGGGGGGGGGGLPEFEFSGGFGVVDQSYGLDPSGNLMGTTLPNSEFSVSVSTTTNRYNNEKIGLSSNPSNVYNKSPNPPPMLSNNLRPPPISLSPAMFNQPQGLLINQHQAHHTPNPSFFLPLPNTHQDQHHQHQHLLLPPPAKRLNAGGGGGTTQQNSSIVAKAPFGDSGKELFMRQNQEQIQLLHQHQQAIIDQLYKASELIQTGNPILAQEILARLNQQLSPIGNPFHRAAFYCKEALQLVIHPNNPLSSAPSPHSSPISLIYKIGAFKAFSEISPFIQFANFTCNQALLEVLEGFERVHVIDFDIGYGGQWASLMQELSLRNGGSLSLKITAFASLATTYDQIELSLTQENLNHFASELNMGFEFEVLSLDSLNSLPLQVSENEAIAVNLPIGSFSNSQLSLPLILRFVKKLSPKIVVSVDRGYDRTDLPFPNHVIHVLQSFSNLLESIDAVNFNLDAIQKIERYLIQPGIEKIMTGRYRFPEKTQHWRALFLSSGFSPLPFSNFTESQAECVVKRTPVRGFQVEKRQSSLVLCWHRKELVSASAWRC